MTGKPETDGLETNVVVELEVAFVCATCGRPLTGDPDEDATGDAGLPICGECARERDFFFLDADPVAWRDRTECQRAGRVRDLRSCDRARDHHRGRPTDDRRRLLE